MSQVRRDDPGGLLLAAALSGIAGVVAAAIAWVVWDIGLNGSVFIGVLVAVLVLAFLVIAFGRQPTKAGVRAAPKAAPKPAAAPVAAPAPAAEATANPAPNPAATTVAQRPSALDGPRKGKADDLKMIKGVGPKMEDMLHSLGFYHFDQVAAWTPAEVAWVDDNLEGFKGRVSRDDWVEQAKLLAAGGETEFSKKVEDGDVY